MPLATIADVFERTRLPERLTRPEIFAVPVTCRFAVIILSMPEVVLATRAWLAVRTPGYLAPPIEITLAELAGSPIAKI